MQPFKTCPHCGQRCVPDMPVCGRCHQPFNTVALMPARPRRLLPVAGLLFAVLLLGILFLSASRPRYAQYPFVGTWVDSQGSGFTFNGDGTGEAFDAISRARFHWHAKAQVITMEYAPSKMRDAAWSMTDDRELLTLSIYPLPEKSPTSLEEMAQQAPINPFESLPKIRTLHRR